MALPDSHTTRNTHIRFVSISLSHTVTCEAAVLAIVSVVTREKNRTEQDFSNNATVGLSVCVCEREREREKERQSLLSQASHYVGCNLSFRGPGRPSDCAEWGSSTGPRCLSCAFTLLSSATLIINREGGVGVWGRGSGGGLGGSGVVKFRTGMGVMVSLQCVGCLSLSC